MSISDKIDRVTRSIGRLNIVATISPDDQMFSAGHERHYFAVGQSAAHVIATALLARKSFPAGAGTVESILDYGCGHGRVARYLRAMFPFARISGTDYLENGVRWCVETFGYDAVSSPILAESYDLIWLGSVFTHLPEGAVRAIIAELKAALRPGGLLVFTTQGRHSARRIRKALDTGQSPDAWLTYNLPDQVASNLATQYDAGQYAYVDYPGQSDYGVTIVPLSWYTNPELVGDDFIVLSAQEKAWDAHQDVVIFMRSDVHPVGGNAFY